MDGRLVRFSTSFSEQPLRRTFNTNELIILIILPPKGPKEPALRRLKVQENRYSLAAYIERKYLDVVL